MKYRNIQQISKGRQIASNNLITNSTFLDSCVRSCDFSTAVLVADHFCGFVAVPIIVAVAFGWRVYMAMSAAGSSNHQDYRSPSDYSKLAFPSYFWPRLANLVLISPTSNTPDCFQQTTLFLCQMQLSMIPMTMAIGQNQQDDKTMFLMSG